MVEASEATKAPQWTEVELEFEAGRGFDNPYTEVDVWAEFGHEATGRSLRRPAFWDGGSTWRVRFASPLLFGEWRWTLHCSDDGAGLGGRTGVLEACPNEGATRFERHGLLRMSAGRRSVVHADGRPFFLTGDTAWALPWRATLEQCEQYAADRQRKGFNAALLMTVCPDLAAQGPRSRTEDFGFDVGFEDLPHGQLNRLNPGYFQYFDQLIDCLVGHEIVPVYQPLFHGYGWKGGPQAGNEVPAAQQARYCRYLVARYGARPALYLVGGDRHGTEPGVEASGEEVERWDSYEQPTGIHYAPHAAPSAHQEKEWLDFQWCQTGHNGEHIPERVADMWRNLPRKGVANGEPSYERIGDPDRATGWWQGHEAWGNVCAGGTMGIVYGAASLWQWRLHANEPGHAGWCTAMEAGWREALEFEGSTYAGLVGKILDGLPCADMEPRPTWTYGRRGVGVPGELFVVYLERQGHIQPLDDRIPRRYRVVDPKTGGQVGQGEWSEENRSVEVDCSAGPRVVIFAAEPGSETS